MACTIEIQVKELGELVKHIQDKNIVALLGTEIGNLQRKMDYKKTTTTSGSKRPTFDTLPAYREEQKNMVYAGIGSRETPKEVLELMTKASTWLEGKGYKLQTGYKKRVGNSIQEEGADKAFSDGTKNKELFGPDMANDKTLKLAEEIHPNLQGMWNGVYNKWKSKVGETKAKEYADGAVNLQARNTFQVFGAKLDTPVDFVLFYAKETDNPLRPKGGTGQAVEMARRKGIPTINMADKDWRKQLTAVLAKSKTEKVEAKVQDKNVDNVDIDTYTNTAVSEELETPPQSVSTGKYELFPGVHANGGQEQAIDNIKEWFSNKQPTYLLKGRGGTGKTTIVNKVLEELGLSSSQVMFATPTNKSKVVIEIANKKSKYNRSDYVTSAALLNYREVSEGVFQKMTSGPNIIPPEEKLEGIEILVVDEVSMLNSKHKAELEAAAAKAGTKMLYMGDNVQLAPVKDFINGVQVKESIVFSEHKKLGDEISELRERMRQGEESPILSVTDSLAESVESGKAPYIDTSKVKDNSPLEVDNSSEESRLNKFVEAFKKDPSLTRWIMFNNQTSTAFGRRITQTVRKAVYGDKAKDPIVDGEQLYVASQFQHEEGDQTLLLYNGMEATVESVTYGNLDTSYGNKDIGLHKVQVPVAFVTMTDNLTGKHFVGVPVRIPATEVMIEQLVEKLKKSNRPNHAKSAKGLYYKMADKISFAGVINAHKAQGSTYNTVFVDVENIMAMPGDDDARGKALYVATSRPREKLVLMNMREQDTVEDYVAEAETKYDDDTILDQEAYDEALEAFNRCMQ